jgi:hypothetical protein
MGLPVHSKAIGAVSGSCSGYRRPHLFGELSYG